MPKRAASDDGFDDGDVDAAHHHVVRELDGLRAAEVACVADVGGHRVQGGADPLDEVFVAANEAGRGVPAWAAAVLRVSATLTRFEVHELKAFGGGFDGLGGDGAEVDEELGIGVGGHEVFA